MDKRNVNLDLIKIIACFFVIINHSGSYIFNTTSGSIFIPAYYSMLFSISKSAVPLFIMSTGMLALNKTYDYRMIFRKIMRVLIPLLFISLLLTFRDSAVSFLNIQLFFIDFLANPIIVPYWYLYMLIGLYLILPFVQKLVKVISIQETRFLVVLSLLIPGGLMVISAYSPVRFNSFLTLSLFSIPVGYLLAGHLISLTNLKEVNMFRFGFVYLISILAFFFSVYLPYLTTGQFDYRMDHYGILPISLSSISVFFLLLKLRISSSLKKWIVKVSDLTFGIYLIHYLLIYRVYSVSIVREAINSFPILGTLLFQLAIFTVCAMIIWLIKKLPFVKDYI